MAKQDKQQLGFSEAGRASADAVLEAYSFHELRDVYRLGISIALAKRLKPASEAAQRKTYINVSGLDPDHSIRSCIEVIRADHDGRPYALAERLAESGIADLESHAAAGHSLRDYLKALEGNRDAAGTGPSASTRKKSTKPKKAKTSAKES